MNLPNILTMSRILLIPVIVALIFMDNWTTQWFAFTLYVIAALTDFFDGYLARRMQIISPLGRMLDPIADKLIVGALLIAFAFDGSFDMNLTVAAILIMMREIGVAGLREHLGAEQITVHVSDLGKYKTTVQLVALGAIMLIPLVPSLASAAYAMVWLATGLTVYTGYDYFKRAWPHLIDEKS
ncbi:CDP-diacylglycerol--glycerol-3-phosphate 3-phosphatidyltransferase [Maritalea sp.]|uniref:CDP-diacylglycerol--glycerol-3-phosphate 3-phosphatidyltransferase n=1 Tax=Maritalea sp. TaxID=2003361 RepID=UPI003EF1EE96